jgi:hypothetical protein
VRETIVINETEQSTFVELMETISIDLSTNLNAIHLFEFIVYLTNQLDSNEITMRELWKSWFHLPKIADLFRRLLASSLYKSQEELEHDESWRNSEARMIIPITDSRRSIDGNIGSRRLHRLDLGQTE